MFSSDDTESDAVVTKHFDGNCVPFQLGSFADGWGGGTGGWSFGNYNGVSWATAGISDYSINQWVHLAGVYNNTDLVLYVDGVEEASVSRSGGLCTNNLDVAVGKVIAAEWSGGVASNNAFNGIIDEVAIYNRALTGDEVLFGVYRSFYRKASCTQNART